MNERRCAHERTLNMPALEADRFESCLLCGARRYLYGEHWTGWTRPARIALR